MTRCATAGPCGWPSRPAGPARGTPVWQPTPSRILAAVVLYIFAIGVVRGFAFALGISTLIDIAVFFWFTKPMMTLLARLHVLQQRAPVVRAVAARRSASTSRDAHVARSREGGPDGQAQQARQRRSTRATSRSTSSAASGSGTPSPAIIVLLAVAGLYFKGLNFGIEFEGGVEYTVSLPAGQVTQDNVDEIRDRRRRHRHRRRVLADREHLRADPSACRPRRSPPTRPTQVTDAIAEAVGVDADDRHLHPGRRRQLGRAGAPSAPSPAWWSSSSSWCCSSGPTSASGRCPSAAIVALAHDIVITIGVYALSGFEVTPATVTGLLTILGFSLYDTVVVFDKVRENTKNLRQSRQTYAELANLAVNQTLVRSINTSIVALLPVGAILYVGVVHAGLGRAQGPGARPVRRHGRRCLLLDLHRDPARWCS